MTARECPAALRCRARRVPNPCRPRSSAADGDGPIVESHLESVRIGEPGGAGQDGRGGDGVEHREVGGTQTGGEICRGIDCGPVGVGFGVVTGELFGPEHHRLGRDTTNVDACSAVHPLGPFDHHHPFALLAQDYGKCLAALAESDHDEVFAGVLRACHGAMLPVTRRSGWPRWRGRGSAGAERREPG